jgi:peptidoglycan/LPS O-acetylase OafA/YrhL
LPGLDGLRAVAVTAVLLYHAGMTWFQGGYLGVDVFFVLSGFLITSLLLAEWHKSGRIGLKSFWMRRARRLLPALFVMLAASLAFAVIFLPDEVASLRNDAIAAAAYVTNWYLIFSQKSYFETVGRPSIFQHLWSLAVEEQFYLLWPLILIFVLKFARRLALPLILLGALASAAFMWLAYDPDTDPSRLYYGTDTRAAALLIGAALAFALMHGKNAPAGGRRVLSWLFDAAGLLALGGLIWFFVNLDETQSFVYQGGMQALELVTVVVILAIVYPGTRLLRWLLGGPIMRWIGQRSYGIYLWHWPVFMVTRPELDVMFDGAPLFALRFGATLVLAELSYRFVEIPVRSGSLGRAWQELRSGRRNRVSAQGLRWAGAIMALLGFAILVGVPVVEAKPPAPPDYLVTQQINTIDPQSGATGQGDPTPSPTLAPGPGNLLSAPMASQPNSYSDVPEAPTSTCSPTPTILVPSSTATPAPTSTATAVQPTDTPAAPTEAPPTATKRPAKARATATSRTTPTVEPTASEVLTAETTPTPALPPGVTIGEPTVATIDTPTATATAPAPPPDQATPVPTQPLAPAPNTPTPGQQSGIASLGRITGIGDSVMLGAAPTLKQLGTIYIDAAVGRQVSTAITLLRTYHDQGRLGSVVVIHMGNNGTFSAKQFDQIMSMLSDEKYVLFVNLKVPRSWEAPNNNVIMQGVARYPNSVMVDWRAASINHPEYFANDGYHLTKSGAQVYTNLIGATLRDLANR